jgi:outer membrane protein assembly factor BamB
MGRKLESNTVDTDPVVFQEIVIAGSLDDCSVFAIDLKSGKELWRIKVPDCTYYHFVD